MIKSGYCLYPTTVVFGGRSKSRDDFDEEDDEKCYFWVTAGVRGAAPPFSSNRKCEGTGKTSVMIGNAW